jgi:2-hydroxychromene-2-carboxylate isomerase
MNTGDSGGRGTFASPTLFVGDELHFGKDKLRDSIEAAQSKAL